MSTSTKFKWTLWYHKSNDTDWSLDSYIKLATFSSIEEFGIVYNNLKPLHIQNSMLFVMREGIKSWSQKKIKTEDVSHLKYIDKTFMKHGMN